MAGLKDALHRLLHREPEVGFSVRYQEFRTLLERNNRIQELMADMGDKLSGEYVFDRQYIHSACDELGDLVLKQIAELSALRQAVTRKGDDALFVAFDRVQRALQDELAGRRHFGGGPRVLSLDEITLDRSDEVGRKNAVLGLARNVLDLPTPDGFAVSFRAHREFWEANGLGEAVRAAEARLDALAGRPAAEWAVALKEVSAEIRERVLAGQVPKALAQEIHRAARHVARRSVAATDRLEVPVRETPVTFAVRSSAWEEDEAPSFAGQNLTLLNVGADDLAEAYKRVLAGAYSRRCWLYRRNRGMRSDEAAVAVGMHRMVDARVSGVLYTLDPAPPACGPATAAETCAGPTVDPAADLAAAPGAAAGRAILVSATWGCGAAVTDGSAPVDFFRLEREHPHRVLESRIAVKARRMALAPDGGLEEAEVEPELREAPCLTPEQLARLADAALLLERYDKRPQDMEWAFDREGRLVVLQVRPLALEQAGPEACPDIEAATRNHEALFTGRGLVAQRGVGMGRVFVLRDLERMDEVPQGAVLVTRFPSPRLSRVMRRVHGIVTELGSPTGHLATIAREFRVPTVVRVENATTLLPEGEAVTLDAEHGTVYRGAVEELRYFELTEESVFEDSAEYRLLRRVLERITPLTPMEGGDSALRPGVLPEPDRCRTLHDITRHIHLKAVESLIAYSERAGNGCPAPMRLETGLPLGLVVLDFDGGVEPGAARAGRDLVCADIASLPLRPLLQGMLCTDMWPRDPVSVDLGSFLSSFTRTLSFSQAAPDKVGRNLAVIGRRYLNLGLRLGYHSSWIVAQISDVLEENYATFTFLGGVTHVTRRSRRARFLADILERFDFRTDVRGDMVTARFKNGQPARMQEQLRLLGWLIGYTRQLDVQMYDDEQVDACVADFLQRVQKNREAGDDRDC